MKLTLEIGYEINLPSYKFDRWPTHFSWFRWMWNVFLWSFSISFHPTNMSYLPQYIQSQCVAQRRRCSWNKKIWAKVNVKLNLFIYLSFPRYEKLNVANNKYPKPSEVKMTTNVYGWVRDKWKRKNKNKKSGSRFYEKTKFGKPNFYYIK